MEQYDCLECGATFSMRKVLGRHVKDVHGLEYLVYLARHGQSEIVTCHCGKKFENTRIPGGGRKGGPRQKYCSPRCCQIATACRHYGLDTKIYWELQSKGCAICGQHETANGREMLTIDHDHTTGKVRGLLCLVCNRYRVGSNTLETALAVVEYLRNS
jgi:hypothetical protein